MPPWTSGGPVHLGLTIFYCWHLNWLEFLEATLFGKYSLDGLMNFLKWGWIYSLLEDFGQMIRPVLFDYRLS